MKDFEYQPAPAVDDPIDDEDLDIEQAQVDWCPDMRDML